MDIKIESNYKFSYIPYRKSLKETGYLSDMFDLSIQEINKNKTISIFTGQNNNKNIEILKYNNNFYLKLMTKNHFLDIIKNDPTNKTNPFNKNLNNNNVYQNNFIGNFLKKNENFSTIEDFMINKDIKKIREFTTHKEETIKLLNKRSKQLLLVDDFLYEQIPEPCICVSLETNKNNNYFNISHINFDNIYQINILLNYSFNTNKTDFELNNDLGFYKKRNNFCRVFNISELDKALLFANSFQIEDINNYIVPDFINQNESVFFGETEYIRKNLEIILNQKIGDLQNIEKKQSLILYDIITDFFSTPELSNNIIHQLNNIINLDENCNTFDLNTKNLLLDLIKIYKERNEYSDIYNYLNIDKTYKHTKDYSFITILSEYNRLKLMKTFNIKNNTFKPLSNDSLNIAIFKDKELISIIETQKNINNHEYEITKNPIYINKKYFFNDIKNISCDFLKQINLSIEKENSLNILHI